MLLVTPCGGAVWVTRTPNGVPGRSKEPFSHPKRFAGVRANLLLANFTFEVDKTGDGLRLTGGVLIQIAQLGGQRLLGAGHSPAVVFGQLPDRRDALFIHGVSAEKGGGLSG